MQVTVSSNTPVEELLELPALVVMTKKVGSGIVTLYGLASKIEWRVGNSGTVFIVPLHYEVTNNTKVTYRLHVSDWFSFDTLKLLPPNQTVILSN